ncbi:putative cyclic phosphodiesterase [Vibrio phage 150E35-1]|nr:putative cyclic phosphodiesterase [Vibrio phage 150E35-1]
MYSASKILDICERLDVENNYIGVKVLLDDAKRIYEHLESIGMKGIMDPSDMHCTLMYSKVPMTGELTPPHDDYEATVVGYELFDSKKDTLVVLLDSPSLAESHEDIKRERGGVPTYDIYKPHITIKNGADVSDLDLVRSNPLKIRDVLLTGNYSGDV